METTGGLELVCKSHLLSEWSDARNHPRTSSPSSRLPGFQRMVASPLVWTVE